MTSSRECRAWWACRRGCHEETAPVECKLYGA